MEELKVILLEENETVLNEEMYVADMVFQLTTKGVKILKTRFNIEK